MSKIELLNDTNFNSFISETKSLVLVDFWAAWCGPCKMLAPILEEISTDMGDGITVAKVNVDEAEEISRNFGIMSIPTIMLFKDGKMVGKSVGLKSKQAIIDIIDKNRAK